MTHPPERCALELALTGDGSGGPAIVLVHSSVSGPKQWRRLIAAAQARFGASRAVYAASLPGYGDTAGWPPDAPQLTLAEYAAPLAASLAEIDGPLHLVGHSMGGSAAMAAAAQLGEKAARLVLFEPNPFFLLRETGQTAAWSEAAELLSRMRELLAAGDLTAAAAGFCDYWEGAGAWAAAPQMRKDAFLAGFEPIRWELSAVWDGPSPQEGWGAVLPAQGVLLHAQDTRAPMTAIAAELAKMLPGWRSVEVARGGHLAPITEPELVNPLILQALA